MNNRRTALAFAIALVGTVALAGCNRDREVETPMVDQAPAPMMTPAPSPALEPAMDAASLRVSSVTVGSNAAADMSVAAQSTLGTRDRIIVSVRTEGSANSVEVGARLTYQDGQVVDEETVTLNTSSAETTNIEFSNTDAWPAGTYTVQVMVDGQPAGMAQQVQVQ